jgi:hypothetical protein
VKTTSVLGLSAALSISLALFGLSTAFADDKAPAALTGQVISEAEGAMEGVVGALPPDRLFAARPSLQHLPADIGLQKQRADG